MQLNEFFRRLGYLLKRKNQASDLDEEMRLHVELRAAQLSSSGVPTTEALDAARRRFGNRTQIAEQSGETWAFNWLDHLAEDLLFAARTLRKSPAFTVVAVATIALGIGLNTAVFSVVNAVMLRDLPVADAGRLVSLWEEMRQEPDAFRGKDDAASVTGPRRSTVSPANLVDYQNKTHSFEGLAGVDISQSNLTGVGTPERLSGLSVTSNFFPLMRASPALGRVFTADEDHPGHDDVVLIPDELWNRRYGRANILGTTMLLDARPYRIIGILPPGFLPASELGIGVRIDFFVPAAYPPDLVSDQGRGDHEVNVIGRLKPGSSLASARAELKVLSQQLASRFPDTNKNVTAAIAPLRDDVVRKVRTSLIVLLAAVGLIVLVACLNVANLTLVRSIARNREIAMRIALGASRGRVIRTLLTESLVVAALGCLAGLVLGAALIRLLVVLAPASIPRIESTAMDARVFFTTVAVAFLSGIFFGFLPALHITRLDPADSLRSADKNLSGRRQIRWRSALTIAEVSLCTVLLIGAGLLLRSFVAVLNVDLGFQSERILAASIPLPETRYATADQRFRFFEQLEERLRAQPGVLSVAFCNRMPMRGGWGTGIEKQSAVKVNLDADAQAVSVGYFDTLGIRLLRGRLLTSGDRTGQTLVVVINQELARLFYKDTDPIGQFIRRGSTGPWLEIVGVVSDIKRDGKTAKVTPQIYIPAAQTAVYPVRLADLAVRTALNPKQYAAEIQRQVWALDPDQPVTNVKTFDEIISTAVAERRFQTMLLCLFATVAFSLALIGVYGVLSQTVAQRTAELGIRMALGASQRSILAMVLRQAAWLMVAGASSGVLLAFGLSQYMRSLLFGIEPHDWSSYIVAITVLAAVGMVVSLVPARRATSVDPMVALRYE
jgi:putative ABC transport system permease protein